MRKRKPRIFEDSRHHSFNESERLLFQYQALFQEIQWKEPQSQVQMIRD